MNTFGIVALKSNTIFIATVGNADIDVHCVAIILQCDSVSVTT